MIIVNNDDVSMMLGEHLMSLSEYLDIYLSDLEIKKEQEMNHPLPPDVFKTMQFMEGQ